MRLLTLPVCSETTRILELLLSAMKRTGSPFIVPLQMPRGVARQAVIGSELFRFSSSPLPMIAEQEFFCKILQSTNKNSNLFFSIQLIYMSFHH